MRKAFSDVIEKARIAHGMLRSQRGEFSGAFVLPSPMNRAEHIKIIASDGDGWQEAGLPLPVWEHVSVSLVDRCPTWPEMCWVKEQFFEPDEWVVQFHPATKDNISHHDFCLHLWRMKDSEFPKPPSICVAPPPKGKLP